MQALGGCLGLGPAAHIQLAKQPADVSFQRVFRDIENLPDFLVGLVIVDQTQDFHFFVKF